MTQCSCRAGSAGWLLASLAAIVAWLAGPASAQDLRFRFDNQPILDAPLQFTFQRDASALRDDGTIAGPNLPRFRAPRLLSPLPEIVTVPSTANEPAINILAAGVAEDGVTPVWVVGFFSKVKLQVYVGQLGGTPYDYLISYNWQKGNNLDGLAQSVDNRPDEAWRPVSGAVCHGMIVLQCNVSVPLGPGWVANRIGFMTCRVADLAGPKNLWWRRHSVSDPLSPLPTGVGLGSVWSVQSWWSTQRDGSRPTKAWIAGTDYHSAPNKDGGTYMLFPIQRSSETSSDWTASPVVELPGRWNDPTLRSHAHSLGVTRFGTQGILALGSRGDSTGSSADYAWTLGNEQNYALGSTAAPGGFNWFIAGPSWSGPQIVHGMVDFSMSNLQTRIKGNQFVGIAPGPANGTFLVGADEVSEPFTQTNDLSSSVSTLRFTAPYRISQTLPVAGSGNESPWRHYLMFNIRKPSPNALGGPYIAQLSPSQNDSDGWNNQRVLYSPDGQRWTQAWAHQEGTQTPVWLLNNRIYVGSYGKHSGEGLRSIAVPDLVDARPLTVAPGGRNAAVATPQVSGAGTGVAVLTNPALPGYVTPPPCSGPVYRIINSPPAPSVGSSALGTYRLASGIPAGSTKVTVKFWVRGDTPFESGRGDSLVLMAKLKSSNAQGTPNSIKTSVNSTSIDLSATGQWMPVILVTDLSKWAATNTWDASGGFLDMVLSNAWDLACPTSFYLAIESVSWEPSPPYPSSVATTLPNEVAEISGFSKAGAWTAFVAGMVPEASWDGTWTGEVPAPKPIFSIISETGLSWVDVLAEQTQSAVLLRPGGLAAGEAWTIAPYNWWPGSPAYFAVTYCPEWHGFILHGSVGNSPIRSSYAAYGMLDAPAAKIRFGSGDGQKVTEFDIFGGAIVDGEATLADASEVFKTLPMLRGLPMPPMTGDCTDMATGPCTADFDGSGFIDTDDFDAFIRAFEAGDQSADFDKSGFVDTDDFDGFVLAFEGGC